MDSDNRLKTTLKILLIMSTLMHLANYLIIPILPIFLNTSKSLNPLLISIIISFNLLFLEVGSLSGGLLSDKIHHKNIILAGALINAVSTYLFSIMNNFYLLLIMWSISGFGHGMMAPTIKCALNDMCDNSDDKQNIFSKRGIFANSGLLIAGLAILLGLGNHQYLIFIISASILLLILAFSFFIKTKPKANSKLKLKEYVKIIKNRTFLLLGLLILIINFGYSQLSYLLPLKLNELALPHTSVGLIWLVMSLEVIVFQNFITQLIIRRKKLQAVLFMASITFSIGVILTGFSKSLIFLIISALIFTIGQMLITPSIDTSVGEISKESNSGIMYSLSHLLHGLGQAIGTSFSGFIVSYFQLSFTTFLIITIALIGSSVVILFFRKLKIESKIQP